MTEIFKLEDFGPEEHTISPRTAVKIATIVFKDWLEKQIVVRSWGSKESWFTNDCTGETPTHKARLVCVEPIERDTAEDILRDFIKTAHIHAFDDSEWGQLAKRAKALLEGR